MSRELRAGWILGAGAALVVLGTLAGVGGSLLLAPLGIGTAGVGFWLRRGVHPAQPAWVVASGVLAVVVGVAVALVSHGGIGLLSMAIGLAIGFSGVRFSLEHARPGAPLAEAIGPGVASAVALDESLRFVWHATSLVSRPPSAESVAEDLLAAASRNRETGLLEDPARAHALPPALEKVQRGQVQVRGVGPVETISFESEFQPRDPEIREAYLDVAANRTAHVALWRHGDRPRPALLCIHGYGLGRLAIDTRVFEAQQLHASLGLDVALIALPWHGPRTLGKRSGQGFMDGHPLWTPAALEQAVWELRRLTGWLRNEGAPAVGAWGISLGGLTTALFASVEPGLACAVPEIPAVSLARERFRSLSESERLAQEASGVTLDCLEAAWATIDPLRYQPRADPEGRLILGARSDRICPPDRVEALWQHWDRPPIHWSPGGHLLGLGRQAKRERLWSHLQGAMNRVAAHQAPQLSHFRR